MVSLVDIIEVQATVNIRGKDFAVPGLDVTKLGYLLKSFPELRALAVGRTSELTPESVATLAPQIVANIIAAGLGKTGDATEIEAATKLALGDQLKIIQAIWTVTFPEGISPFVNTLRALGLIEGEAGGASGWAQAMNSHALSKPSPAPGSASPS